MAPRRYLVDESGKRIAVLLDVEDYERLLKRISELEPLEQRLPPAVIALLRAPEDEAPLDEEDLRALQEADEDLRAGRFISHEEAVKQLLG